MVLMSARKSNLYDEALFSYSIGIMSLFRRSTVEWSRLEQVEKDRSSWVLIHRVLEHVLGLAHSLSRHDNVTVRNIVT